MGICKYAKYICFIQKQLANKVGLIYRWGRVRIGHTERVKHVASS